ncbi:Phenazine biosynthesis protein PhzF like [hydrothermal vent metagenome]|uniref:Phenazine biosynthesis protein PhzF like n=1 Tax=hydrothermal vent metagenome TaxID=652676 RepID=A0A3B1C0Q7_9ZZZZ
MRVAGVKIFGVDAFTSKPFSGNPAAVCLLTESVTDDWMQSVAMEMNLSETAFVEKVNDGEYNLRWFTPKVEVDLCGHATLASAHILWETGECRADRIIFNTKSGQLTAVRSDGHIELDFPQVQPEPASAPTGLLEGLGVKESVNVMKAGPDFLVELGFENEIKKLKPDFARLGSIDMRTVVVTARGGDTDIDFVSRVFAPSAGIDEDPVTGSTHCALGPYWSGKMDKKEFKARQISKRGGEIGVKLKGGRAILSGKAVTVWAGSLIL